jgi:anaerobic ribonucleoside-triphosphate reductase activating protein
MNYADIKQYDIANGPGVRVSLFVSGCTHRCKNCFNKEAWDFSYGTPFTEATEEMILSYLAKPYVKGLTLLGGEPFERENQKALVPFLRKVKERFPEKDIWAFSGYDFEKDITDYMLRDWEATEELLSMIDVLVDGEFIEEQKSLNLRFKGSANQRTILVQESLATRELVLYDLEEGTK